MKTLELSEHLERSKLIIEPDKRIEEKATIEEPKIYGYKSDEIIEYENKIKTENKKIKIENALLTRKEPYLFKPHLLNKSYCALYKEIIDILELNHIRYTVITREEYQNIFNKCVVYPKSEIEGIFKVKLPDEITGLKLPLWMTYSIYSNFWSDKKPYVLDIIPKTNYLKTVIYNYYTSETTSFKNFTSDRYTVWDYPEELYTDELQYNDLGCKPGNNNKKLSFYINPETIPIVPKRLNHIIELIPDYRKRGIHIGFMPGYKTELNSFREPQTLEFIDDPFIYFESVEKFSASDDPIIVFGWWNKSGSSLDIYNNE
jgi:hypothetical protein